MDIEDGNVRIFVYGTLMKGEANHDLIMSDAKYEGKYRTENRWGLINIGAFPALVPHVLEVEGEVYTIDVETLARIDRLEGYNSETNHGMYIRRWIKVYSQDDDSEDEVQTYMWGKITGNLTPKMRRWSDFQ